MVTKTQIKRFAASFLERHTEFVWRQHYDLIHAPFASHLRGFSFDRSSIKNRTYVYYFVDPLYFQPKGGLSFSFGKRMFGSDGYAWDVTNEESAIALFNQMEEAWNRLNVVESITDFVAYISEEQWVPPARTLNNDVVRAQVSAALGDWPKAIEALQGVVEYDAQMHARGYSEPAFKKIREDRALLLKTLQENPSGVYALLHQWEAETVKNLGLEEHWRPMRFPGEGAPVEPSEQ